MDGTIVSPEALGDEIGRPVNHASHKGWFFLLSLVVYIRAVSHTLIRFQGAGGGLWKKRVEETVPDWPRSLFHPSTNQADGVPGRRPQSTQFCQAFRAQHKERHFELNKLLERGRRWTVSRPFASSSRCIPHHIWVHGERGWAWMEALAWIRLPLLLFPLRLFHCQTCPSWASPWKTDALCRHRRHETWRRARDRALRTRKEAIKGNFHDFSRFMST